MQPGRVPGPPLFAKIPVKFHERPLFELIAQELAEAAEKGEGGLEHNARTTRHLHPI